MFRHIARHMRSNAYLICYTLVSLYSIKSVLKLMFKAYNTYRDHTRLQLNIIHYSYVTVYPKIENENQDDNFCKLSQISIESNIPSVYQLPSLYKVNSIVGYIYIESSNLTYKNCVEDEPLIAIKLTHLAHGMNPESLGTAHSAQNDNIDSDLYETPYIYHSFQLAQNETKSSLSLTPFHYLDIKTDGNLDSANNFFHKKRKDNTEINNILTNNRCYKKIINRNKSNDQWSNLLHFDNKYIYLHPSVSILVDNPLTVTCKLMPINFKIIEYREILHPNYNSKIPNITMNLHPLSICHNRIKVRLEIDIENKLIEGLFIFHSQLYISQLNQFIHTRLRSSTTDIPDLFDNCTDKPNYIYMGEIQLLPIKNMSCNAIITYSYRTWYPLLVEKLLKLYKNTNTTDIPLMNYKPLQNISHLISMMYFSSIKNLNIGSLYLRPSNIRQLGYKLLNNTTYNMCKGCHYWFLGDVKNTKQTEIKFEVHLNLCTNNSAYANEISFSLSELFNFINEFNQLKYPKFEIIGTLSDSELFGSIQLDPTLTHNFPVPTQQHSIFLNYVL